MFKISVNKLKLSLKINKLSKRHYSEVYDDIVKLSEDIHHNEFKVPAYEKSLSIFFNENDKILDLQERIKGSNEKIQKVEFLDWEKEVEIDKDTNFLDFRKDPFKIKINNHLVIKYVPSLNSLILNQNHKFNIVNNFNNLLFQSSQFINKNEIENKLNILLQNYEKLYEEYQKAENILESRFNSKTRLYINLGFLFFVAHAILFYFLIYQWYGWDTIEPITYIVGNVYWIAGLLFFIYKKKKLDFSFFSSESFKDNFIKINGKRLGYSERGMRFVKDEIMEIRKFKDVMNNRI